MAGEFSGGRVLRTQASCARIIAIVLLALGFTQAAPQSGFDLWSNPCSSHVVLRHPRSTAEQELKFLITTLKKDMFKDLKYLYPKNHIKVISGKGSCPKLNKLIKRVNAAPNITIAYQKFHLSMIELYVFLDQLKETKISTTHDFNLTARRDIYEKTKSILRLTICEFNEHILNEHKIKLGTTNPPLVNTHCLPKEADLTKIHLLDMQFFKKLVRFFKTGQKILRNKRKPKNGKRKVKKSFPTSVR
ncbi:uncharacterized protein [Euwallacea similis]|uniref:uncharacterized protein isoform X1 n=1 Tax=Euwallacea similis TaxID=1736056 RepID=UPI00344B74BB